MKSVEKLNFRKFGLVGKDISYSFSPTYFHQKFENEGINAAYKLFDIQNIHHFSHIFLKNNIAGLNVTIPYKEQIINFLDELSPEASKIGAVNTIQFKGQKLIGHNTDYLGFKKSIEPLLQSHHKSALILGTGGATKAVKFALNQLNIDFKTVSRDVKKANFTYTELNEEILKKFQIIINATPLGTFPNIDSYPKIPFSGIDSTFLAYDLIYNPEKTTFLQKCEKQGATIKNGLEMLQIQADEAWKIWNKH